MAIDAALGRLGSKAGVCTSTTRPTNPFEGQVVYETDTNRTLVYDNSAWLVVADNQVLSIDTTNGRVGVGTTSPSTQFEINGDYPHLRFHDTDTALSDGEGSGQIEFSNSDSGGAGGVAAYINAVGDGSTGVQSLRFGAGAAGSATDKLTIDGSSGRVGIGDTSPSYTLDVTGDINATGNLRIGGNAIGDWTSFTPSWSNLTVGNGTQSAQYARVNDVVTVIFYLSLGSTSSVSAGASFVFPVTATGYPALQVMGEVSMYDNGSHIYSGPIMNNSNTVEMRFYEVLGTNIRSRAISSTLPFTWTTTDLLAGTFSYRAA